MSQLKNDFPANWKGVKISKVTEVVGGSTPSTKEESYWDGNITWATPTDLTELRGVEITNTEKQITEEGLDSTSTHVLPENSLLLTTRASIGKCAINSVPMATNQGFQNLIPDGEINTWYLYYRIRDMADYLESLGAGSTFSEISKKTVSNVKIPVPPKPEQRKIASVLYTVDQAIQKTEEIIEQRERIKRGLRQDIFKHGLDSNGDLRRIDNNQKSFEDTKYGVIPKYWNQVSLNEIVPDDAPIVYGILMPGDHQPNGVPVIKVKDIKDGEIKDGDLLHTAPDIHENFKRAELKEGDLLFSIRGTVGRMAFVPSHLEGSNITQDTARIRISEANPRFIRHYLKTSTPRNFFERNTIGQAVQGINLGRVREVPVHLPKREEQDRIVEILDQHLEQIQKERRYLEKLKSFKKGLMQDLLTGEVRTNDKNIKILDEVLEHG